MTTSDTPETDATLVDHMPKDATEWSEHYLTLCIHSRKLERERNDAREELEEYRSIAENIGAEKAISEKEKAIRERDELQMAVNGLCLHFGVRPANTTLLAVEVLRIQRERDEAITRRMETIMQCELYKQERDELLNEIKRLRLDAQREAEHHDRMVKELEGLYDKLKS